MVKRRKIEWDDEAKLYFRQAIQYIKQESPQGAETVRKAVLEQLSVLKQNPEIYEQDRFKQNNDGTYRALTVYSYRITYKIEETHIFILRVRHTSQTPVNY